MVQKISALASIIDTYDFNKNGKLEKGEIEEIKKAGYDTSIFTENMSLSDAKTRIKEAEIKEKAQESGQSGETTKIAPAKKAQNSPIQGIQNPLVSQDGLEAQKLAFKRQNKDPEKTLDYIA